MKSIPFVGLVGLAGLVSAPGCERHEGQERAIPAASVSRPSAPSASPATVAPESSARLAVVAPNLVVEEQQGHEALVSLVLTGTDFRVPIANLRDPWACVGTSFGDDRWGVRCTPRFRRYVATVQRLSDGIGVVYDSPGSDRPQKRILEQRPIRLDTTPEFVVSAHSAPGKGCEESLSPQPPVPVALESGHDINGKNDTLHLTVGLSVLELVDHWAYKHCSPVAEADAMRVVCPEGPKHTEGRFWLVSLASGQRAVRFSWREEESFQAAMVLPCGREGRLRPPPDFRGGIHNYGAIAPSSQRIAQY